MQEVRAILPVHVCRICDYIFVIQEGQKRLSERPPLIVQTMLLRQKKMVKLLDCFTCMYIVDGTFLCAEDELVTVQLPPKQTRARSKCLCTRVCGVRDDIFVTYFCDRKVRKDSAGGHRS